MPYNELQRRDSWPPTILRLRDDEPEDLSSIDENPFSFFLTSPEDLSDDEDLSAGIETPSPKTPVREVSPSTLQRIALPSASLKSDEEVGDIEEEDFDFGFGLAMPMSLRDFTAKHNGRKSRLGRREEELKGLGIAIPESSTTIGRGRAKVRLQPRGRGRGQTRSLSARRTASWRVPSPDIWSIEEEREEDMNGKEKETQVSVSAPTSALVGGLSPNVEVKKKKRVHWAL